MKQMLALKPMLITLYPGLLVLALLATGWFLVRAQTWTGVGLAVVAMLVVTLPAPLVAWLSQSGPGPGRAGADGGHLAFYPDRRAVTGFAGAASLQRAIRVSPL